MALDGRTRFQSLPEVGVRRDNNVNEAVAEQSRAPDDEFGGGGKYHLVPHFQFHRDTLHGRQDARIAADVPDAGATEKKVGAGKQAAGVGEINLQVVEFFQALAETSEVDDKEGHHGEAGNDEKADLGFDAGIAIIHSVQGSSCDRPSTKSRITGSVEARNWSQVP